MADGSPRRFAPPWRADRIPGGYVVRDANRQAIAYIYSRHTRNSSRRRWRSWSSLRASWRRSRRRRPLTSLIHPGANWGGRGDGFYETESCVGHPGKASSRAQRPVPLPVIGFGTTAGREVKRRLIPCPRPPYGAPIPDERRLLRWRLGAVPVPDLESRDHGGQGD